MDKIEFVYYIIVVCWYGAFIYILYSIYVRYGIPYDSAYDKEYCEKAPSSLTPGALSLLMYRKIVPEVFTTTILVLIKKGILSVKCKSEDYILTLTVDAESQPKLSNSQKYILNFLMTMTNKKNEVSLTKINNMCKSHTSSSDFLLNYQIWKRIILKESCQQRFFEDKIEYEKIKMVKYIGLFLFFINFIFQFNTLAGYFILIPTYFLSFYFYKVYKRTIEANEEYHKWLAFKRYLSNINKFNYNPKEVDRYLLYATIFKINKEFDSQFCENLSSQFVRKLNDSINHCVLRANLYGNRGIKYIGNDY